MDGYPSAYSTAKCWERDLMVVDVQTGKYHKHGWKLLQSIMEQTKKTYFCDKILGDIDFLFCKP